MLCPSCQATNRDRARYCASCGATLPLVCVHCGAALSPTSKFCAECGTTVRPEAVLPRGAGGVLPPGAVLEGRYRIERLLGQGGFARVYLAQDQAQRRACAVKELADSSLEGQRQFEREASLLRRLSHQRLVRVTDHFQTVGGGMFLVMDYIEGQDLDQTVDQAPGALPEERVVKWGLQVCDVLEYMHTWVDPSTGQPSPVIHRDIKPGNLRLQPDDGVIVIDLGIAKIKQAGGTTTRAARAISPPYSPLEQYGQGTDERSDIYALGATLYHLTTGHAPPEAVDLARTPLVAPRALNPALAAHLDQVILRAMQLDPDDRFQSVAGVRAALTTRSASAVLTHARANQQEAAQLRGLYDQAAAAIARRDWQPAIDKLEELQRLAPSYRDTPALLRHARQELAEVRAQRVLALRDEAERHVQSGRWDAAVVALQAVLILAPGDASTRQRLDEIPFERERERDRRAEALYQKATDANAAGRRADAILVLRQLQAVRPGYRGSDQLLATLLHPIGQPPAAPAERPVSVPAARTRTPVPPKEPSSTRAAGGPPAPVWPFLVFVAVAVAVCILVALLAPGLRSLIAPGLVFPSATTTARPTSTLLPTPSPTHALAPTPSPTHALAPTPSPTPTLAASASPTRTLAFTPAPGPLDGGGLQGTARSPLGPLPVVSGDMDVAKGRWRQLYPR